MLTGMLLHVIAPTINVNQAVNARAFLNRLCILENVKNRAVISFRHLGHTQSVARLFALGGENPAHIKDLPAAGGIERGAIQNHGRTRIRVRCRNQIQTLLHRIRKEKNRGSRDVRS